MKPPKSILNRAFRYTPAAKTDIRRTFARARRELAAAAQVEQENRNEAASKVLPLPKERRK